MSRIMVGYDGVERSSRTLEWAAGEAARWGAELEVVHVWHRDHVGRGAAAIGNGESEETAERALADALSAVERMSEDVKASGRLVNALSVPEALVEAGSNADLVVIGARGSRDHHSAGSTVDSVIKHVTVPVVVVP